MMTYNSQRKYLGVALHNTFSALMHDDSAAEEKALEKSQIEVVIDSLENLHHRGLIDVRRIKEFDAINKNHAIKYVISRDDYVLIPEFQSTYSDSVTKHKLRIVASESNDMEFEVFRLSYNGILPKIVDHLLSGTDFALHGSIIAMGARENVQYFERSLEGVLLFLGLDVERWEKGFRCQIDLMNWIAKSRFTCVGFKESSPDLWKYINKYEHIVSEIIAKFPYVPGTPDPIHEGVRELEASTRFPLGDSFPSDFVYTDRRIEPSSNLPYRDCRVITDRYWDGETTAIKKRDVLLKRYTSSNEGTPGTSVSSKASSTKRKKHHRRRRKSPAIAQRYCKTLQALLGDDFASKQVFANYLRIVPGFLRCQNKLGFEKMKVLICSIYPAWCIIENR